MIFTNFNIITFIIFIVIIYFLGYFFYKTYKKQIKFNNEFNLLSSYNFFYIKYIFLLLSIFLILIANFGIKYGDKKNINSNKGIDIMFVLDVSKSMNVADIRDSNYSYTRLDIAKESIGKFIISNKQNRYGLVIFSGDAISTIPLTTDYNLFLTFLKGVDYKNLIKQGSDFEKALNLGTQRFNFEDDRSKALIFISDGGDFDDFINKNNIKKIKEKNKNIAYFILGVGTNKGGKIITGVDLFGRYTYQKYKGKYVISSLNKGNLKKIASILNGEYFEISNIEDILYINKNINKLQKKAIESNFNGELKDIGRVLSILSFISFILFFIIYFYENRHILLTNKKIGKQ